jgi:hypothetical protein
VSLWRNHLSSPFSSIYVSKFDEKHRAINMIMNEGLTRYKKTEKYKSYMKEYMRNYRKKQRKILLDLKRRVKELDGKK